MQIWSEARQIAERTLGLDHVALAEILRRLGLAEYSIGNLAEGRQLHQTALQIGERWLAPCDLAAAALVNDLAASFHDDGEYAEARRLYRRAAVTLDECASTAGVDRAPDIRATTVLNEARLAAQVGDLSEAERLYRAAAAIWSAALGAAVSPPTPSLAAFVVRAGENDVALVPLGRVDEIERRISEWRAEAGGRRCSPAATRPRPTERTGAPEAVSVAWSGIPSQPVSAAHHESS